MFFNINLIIMYGSFSLALNIQTVIFKERIPLVYYVRKDLTCTFRASCDSARFSVALVLTWVSLFVQQKVLLNRKFLFIMNRERIFLNPQHTFK